MRIRLLLLTLLAALCASAADIDGTWKGTAESPNGTFERTFMFKADGTKLTGETTSQMMGKSVINDGKIDGANLSFTIKINFQGNDVQVNYKGKLDGDTLKLSAETPDFKLEYTAKKVS